MMFSKGSPYLQVLVEADNSSGCEGQRQEVGEGEPEPELCEDQQADHWGHVSVTRPGLQGDGHITSTWRTEGADSLSAFKEIHSRNLIMKNNN